MKLYVWSNPYPVSYGSSMVFAIANSLEEAKLIAADKERCTAYAYNEFKQDSLPGVSLGEPIRVVDLPCAEWHEWSE